MSENTEQAVSNVIPFPTREELAARLEGVQFAEWIFSNDKANPFPQQVLHMFYDGILNNKVGVMAAKDKESGDPVLILVGIMKDEEGNVGCFPLARVLQGEEAGSFYAPDGHGGWVGEEVNDDSDESSKQI